MATDKGSIEDVLFEVKWTDEGDETFCKFSVWMIFSRKLLSNEMMF